MPASDEETVDQLAQLYDRHDQRTSGIQRAADRMTSALGKPVALLVIFSFAITWVVGNYIAWSVGSTALEEFPFPDLGFIATIAALLVALLILTTQRHQEALAESRAQLTLHIAMLSERKIAKVIELLEEQRRDNPMLPSRVDAEATALAEPSNHETTLTLIEEATDQRRQTGDEGRVLADPRAA